MRTGAGAAATELAASGLGHAERGQTGKVTEAQVRVGVKQDVGRLVIAVDDGRVGVVESASRPVYLGLEAGGARGEQVIECPAAAPTGVHVARHVGERHAAQGVPGHDAVARRG